MTAEQAGDPQALVEALTRENAVLRQSVDRLRRLRAALLDDARATRLELASLRSQHDALGTALRPFLATPSPGGGTVQDISLHQVERAWDEVLALVKAVKRVTHARLMASRPVGLDAGRLTVQFSTPTLARQFAEGIHPEVLEDALLAALGSHLQVQCQGPPPAPAGAWIETRSDAAEPGAS